MIWLEPVNHVNDCYFYVVNEFGCKAKNKHKFIYPSVRSAMIPVPHLDELSQPVFHELPSDD